MYVSDDIYICMFIYIYIDIHTYIDTYIHRYIHYIHTYIYRFYLKWVMTYDKTCLHCKYLSLLLCLSSIYVCTYVYMCVYVCLYICISMMPLRKYFSLPLLSICVYAHRRKHAYTAMLSLSVMLSIIHIFDIVYGMIVDYLDRECNIYVL